MNKLLVIILLVFIYKVNYAQFFIETDINYSSPYNLCKNNFIENTYDEVNTLYYSKKTSETYHINLYKGLNYKFTAGYKFDKYIALHYSFSRVSNNNSFSYGRKKYTQISNSTTVSEILNNTIIKNTYSKTEIYYTYNIKENSIGFEFYYPYKKKINLTGAINLSFIKAELTQYKNTETLINSNKTLVYNSLDSLLYVKDTIYVSNSIYSETNKFNYLNKFNLSYSLGVEYNIYKSFWLNFDISYKPNNFDIIYYEQSIKEESKYPDNIILYRNNTIETNNRYFFPTINYTIGIKYYPDFKKIFSKKKKEEQTTEDNKIIPDKVEKDNKTEQKEETKK